MIKNILCVTSSRSEIDLLSKTLQTIHSRKKLNLSILGVGSHSNKDFGDAFEGIKSLGINSIEKIETLLLDDNNFAMGKSLAKCIDIAVDYMNSHKPDGLIILGDRFEIVGFAQAAKVLNIPIFHIAGGDTSLGSLDNLFRDIISICSSLHFAKLPKHKKKIENLGIDKENIFITGSLSNDNFNFFKSQPKKNVKDIIGKKIKLKFAMVSFHPVTKPFHVFDNDIDELLNTLEKFKNIHFIFTSSNQDPMGILFNKKIKEFVFKNSSHTEFIPNLGLINYFTMLSSASFMIGNSSSGVIESALFKIPSIIIRPRQDGRAKNENVIECLNRRDEIKLSINKALSNEFIKKAKKTKNIYRLFKNKDISDIIVSKIEEFYEK